MWMSIFCVLSVPSFLHFSAGEPFFFNCPPPVFLPLSFSVTQLLLDKLRSFNSDVPLLFFFAFILISPMHFQPPLCISSDDTHHAMIGAFPLCASMYFLTSKIASILILNRASLLYASPSRPTLEGALDQAYYQYKSSRTHNAVKEQFSFHPKQYSVSQITDFVLSHRL